MTSAFRLSALTLGSTTVETQEGAVGEILSALLDNEHQARSTINLVASENAMSGLAKLPLLLDTYHRYFFNETHDPRRWNFRSAAPAARLETDFTIPILRELARAAHVSIRPLSGLSGMALVLAAYGGPPSSCVAVIAPENGGHYATPDIARRFGQRVVFLGGPNPHELDYAAAAAVVAANRPALIYVDQSNCLFPIDISALVRRVRAVDDSVIIHVDVSHWLGLVLGGVFDNPLDCGADSFGGSTHKTFPGPQKAILCTNRADLDEQLRAAQEFLVSSHHFGAGLSLGLALAEFRDCGGPEYAQAILKNTQQFGRLLHERGLPVVAADRGFSAGHQLWLDTAAEGLPAQVASDRLYAAGLRVNFQPLPGLCMPAVRVGLNEATYRGLREPEIGELADIFVLAIGMQAPSAGLAARTAELRSRCRPQATFPLGKDPLMDTVARLCLAAVLEVPPLAVDDALCQAVSEFAASIS